mgnify:FL=1
MLQLRRFVSSSINDRKLILIYLASFYINYPAHYQGSTGLDRQGRDTVGVSTAGTLVRPG